MNPGPRLSSADETGKEVPIFQILPVNAPFQQNRVQSGSLAKNRGRCFDSWGATVSQFKGRLYAGGNVGHHRHNSRSGRRRLPRNSTLPGLSRWPDER